MRYEKSTIAKCSKCKKVVSARTVTCGVCNEEERERKRKAWPASREERKRKTIARKTKACAACGCFFVAKNSLQKTCSRKCAAEILHINGTDTRSCRACGAIFSCGKKSEKSFCSHKCVASTQKKDVLVSCFRCGIEFVTWPSHVKKRSQGKHIGDKKHFCTKACHIEWQKENRRREQASPKKALFHRVRNVIRNAAVLGKETKNFKEIFGYSAADLRAWLEGKFKPGMTWANYGKWHIDHIIPLSKLNYTCATDPDFIRAWSLKNLQPLWAQENFRKSDNLHRPIQPSLSFGATQ